MDLQKATSKIWHFIWEENNIWSWLANIILAFILIKFIIYPAIGFILGTQYPIVAVVSGRMLHKPAMHTKKNTNRKLQQIQHKQTRIHKIPIHKRIQQRRHNDTNKPK